MESILHFRQAVIADVTPGEVFAASIGQGTTICLAVQPLEGEREPGLVALSPGHPMLRNQPGLLNGSVLSGQPLLVYPQARFAASPRVQHLRFDAYAGTPNGTLLLLGDRFGVVAATGNRSRAVFSCHDGSVIGSVLGRTDTVLFTSWEILVDGPGGEPHTLCVIDAGSVPET